MSLRKTDGLEVKKMCFLIIFHPKDCWLLSRSFFIQQKLFGQETCGEMEREGENERGEEQKRKRERKRQRENPLPALPSQ